MTVQWLTISEDHSGQRLDNFLVTVLKGVPKSRIYRAIRKGEVRVNKGRVAPEYRLVHGDIVRVPPVRTAEPATIAALDEQRSIQLPRWILYEDSNLMILNKPSGVPVHGGSGLRGGLIEQLRLLRPRQKFLELVHRLDRDTSGCLMIAKKRQALISIQKRWAEKTTEKYYWALVKGRWQGGAKEVSLPLRKNVLQSGERMVKVDQEQGKAAITIFTPLHVYDDASLLQAIPVTGRTHQIRVHAAAIGFPIAGDERYGDDEFNKEMRCRGLNRLFLHSAELSCFLEELDQSVGVCALLEKRLQDLLACL